MSYEVEVKYRTAGHNDLLGRLTSLGAEFSARDSQEDTYLSHPARDFAATNEAFRVRRVGSSNRITYKGPRRTGPTKTREEIEIPFAEGEPTHSQLLRLFANLGFRPVALVRKERQSFRLPDFRGRGRDVEVALDVVADLGTFAEVEAIASGESDLPEVQAVVLDVARELGLSEVEPRSYLRMILEQGNRDTLPS